MLELELEVLLTLVLEVLVTEDEVLLLLVTYHISYHIILFLLSYVVLCHIFVELCCVMSYNISPLQLTPPAPCHDVNDVCVVVDVVA